MEKKENWISPIMVEETLPPVLQFLDEIPNMYVKDVAGN